MGAQADFWGDIGTVDEIRSLVALLREQAALLGSKTKNLVEARVETSTFSDTFRHAFLLIVPALDYRYLLFYVEHEVWMYPLRAHFPHQLLSDEHEFQQWLHDKLSSPETKRIIANLLAQVGN